MAKDSGWQNVGIMHVIPLEDFQPHALNPKCACIPTCHHEFENGDVLIVTHNAFDGRDYDERDAEKLKQIRPAPPAED
jgi:hypothetical protein